MHVTTACLIFSLNLNSTQLELHLIMARKGKPLADDTRIAIIRMFYSGYNKKDIMKALDIGEGSFWRTLKQWQTNCHFRKHLTRETRGRPRKMGIIESSVCHSCINCICQLVNCDLVPGAQNYFHPWHLSWWATEGSWGWEGFMCWPCNYLANTSAPWLYPQASKHEFLF